MSGWLHLNRFHVNRPLKQFINGVEIEVFVSPYDVPEAVRGDYDREKHKFVIRFHYPADQDTAVEEEEFDKITTLGIGKHSRRLRVIELDVDAIKARSVGLVMRVPIITKEVGDAIDTLTSRHGSPLRAGNYRLAKEVITANRDVLFRDLQTAEAE